MRLPALRPLASDKHQEVQAAVIWNESSRGIEMLNAIKKIAVVGFAAVAATSAIAQDVLIDAKAACLSLDTMTGGRVTFQLDAGSYTVSLVDNDMSCGGEDPTGGCLIDTVVIRGGSAAKTGWGLAVKAGKAQQFKVKGVGKFSAIVIDEPCYDNTGSAILRFEKITPQAE